MDEVSKARRPRPKFGWNPARESPIPHCPGCGRSEQVRHDIAPDGMSGWITCQYEDHGGLYQWRYINGILHLNTWIYALTHSP